MTRALGLSGALAAASLVLLAACSTTSTSSTTVGSGPAGTALVVLDTLVVKGRAPKTGYARDQFGPSWSDIDHNGCDTRNDILNRDLRDKQWRPGTHGCVVIAGTITDPYTGNVILFAKADAAAVQIDHVVALSDAWQKGARALSPADRFHLANDPLNLLAVHGPTNASKGDSDAASWLPPSRAFRCEFAARQIAAKARYRLWVTRAERDAPAPGPEPLPERASPG